MLFHLFMEFFILYNMCTLWSFYAEGVSQFRQAASRFYVLSHKSFMIFQFKFFHWYFKILDLLLEFYTLYYLTATSMAKGRLSLVRLPVDFMCAAIHLLEAVNKTKRAWPPTTTQELLYFSLDGVTNKRWPMANIEIIFFDRKNLARALRLICGGD